MLRPAHLTPALLLASLTGCAFGFYFKGSPGVPFNTAKLRDISPERTTFADVLDWFGPPDAIVDGTQRVYDPWALSAPTSSTSARVITAPPGMVILIYYVSGEQSVGWLIAAPVAVDARRETVHANELFIYLSKADRKVVTVAAPPALTR